MQKMYEEKEELQMQMSLFKINSGKTAEIPGLNPTARTGCR